MRTAAAVLSIVARPNLFYLLFVIRLRMSGCTGEAVAVGSALLGAMPRSNRARFCRRAGTRVASGRAVEWPDRAGPRILGRRGEGGFMRSRVGVSVLAVLVVAGCAASNPSATTSGSTPEAVASTTSRAATTEPAMSEPVAPAATTSPLGILRPTPEQEQQMAAALLVIDPRMTNADRYVGRTVDTCDDVRNGEITGDALVARIQQRFSGGTMPDFSADQAQQVIDAVVQVWCH